MNEFKFSEPKWVADFREFIGLNVRLINIRNENWYEYHVISPTGEVLFFVSSHSDSDSIGSTNGPFCSWRKGI